MSPTPVPADDEQRAEGEGRVVPWFRVDADLYADDRIIEIGEACGPAGPAVFLALMGAAKIQNEAGVVRFGWRTLARTCFLPDADTAQQVVGACEDAGLLIVKAITERGFAAEIVKWEHYQRRAPLTNAERASRHRARKRGEKPVTSVTKVTTARDEVTKVTDANGNSGQKTNDSVVPPQQRVAPAAAGLHPAFADVMAIAQEACSSESKMSAPLDSAILATLNAYPGVDHLRGANLAAADVCAGLARQPHFHKILGFKLGDLAKTPAVVDRRSERDKRGAEDLAALQSLRESRT